MRATLHGAAVAAGIVLALTGAAGGAPASLAAAAPGRWVAGDLHTHTVLTDGEATQALVAAKAFGTYRLDWFANSEHGGRFSRDASGNPLGTPMFRWQSLKQHSYPAVQAARVAWPDRLVVQGLEWNVPTHDHVSVGIAADEPTAIADFEYSFDANDTDTSRAGEGLAKQNATHADAIAAVRWLGSRYPASSYVVVNHPSRLLGWTAADLRAMNDAAPMVAFGFEGIPGHQKSIARGGYAAVLGDATSTAWARTYGGADLILAKVGGTWDALLSEGRRFWVFADSDFHSSSTDFWPGEYAKSHVWVRRAGYPGLIEGLRSGESFAATGGLVDGLDFRVRTTRRLARTGGTLWVRHGEAYTIVVRFRSPAANSAGRRVRVDHVDLVSGRLRSRAAPTDSGYARSTDPTIRVGKRFTAAVWRVLPGGWRSATARVPRATRSMYYRLRGTNLRPSHSGETDALGNPLIDDMAGPNDASKAFGDLWFYSNPIFVRVY